MTDDNAYVRPMDADVDPVAYFKKIRDANYQQRFKVNHPDYVVKKKAYDAQRKGRGGKSFVKKSHMGGNFVAIDAEGMDLPEPPYRLDKDGSRKYTPMPMQLKQIKRMRIIRIIAQYYGWLVA